MKKRKVVEKQAEHQEPRSVFYEVTGYWRRIE